MHVVVIGGGLAGLTAAYHLALSGERVTLLEAGPRLGGQVSGRKQRGFLIEDGAEGFPIRRDGVRDLCHGLGLQYRLIDQQVHRSLRLVHGRLEQLAPGEAASLLGIATESGDTGAGLATLRGGMMDLVEALAEFAGTYGRVATRWTATRLNRYRAGWQIERKDGPPLVADAVILATPVWETSSLLAPVIGGVAELRAIRHSASITVSLAAKRDQIDHPLDATGFVGETGSMFRACTFSSSKFEDRAPPGWALLRLYFRVEPEGLSTPDDVWIGYARQQIADVLGFRAHRGPAWVSRWARVLPQFPPRHAEQVEQLRERIDGAGVRLELAGAATGAIGVEGAVRSGQTAAARTRATAAAW